MGLFLSSSLAVATNGSGAGAGSAHQPLAFTPPLNGGITVCGKGVNRTMSPQDSIGGNITVCNGASLTFVNSVVTVHSFTATDNLLLANDLNYRFHVNVTTGGQLHLVNSMLNTTAQSLNAYPKLNLTVDNGVVSLDNSSLAFAGTVYVVNDSTLFLNDSSLMPNPSIPAGPSNVTADNMYAPTLTVFNGSNVVSVNSTIINSYKDSNAPGAPLDQNFIRDTNVTISNNTIYGVGPLDPSYLFYDTYDVWGGATLNLSVYNPIGFSANVGISAYGNTASLRPVVFSPGVHFANFQLPQSFVSSTLQAGGLRGFLDGLQTGKIGVDFTGSTAAPGTSWMANAVLTLIPQYGFNETFADNSHLYAVDSTFDVNWVNSTCFIPSDSNKMYFTGGSSADLLSTSTYAAYSGVGGLCADVNAFDVDSSSQYMVYNWVKVQAVGSTGSPLANAILTVTANGTDQYTNGMFTQASNPAHFDSPLFRNAVEEMAVPAGATYTYGNTSSQGNVTYAIATSSVTRSTLPDGVFVGAYSLSFSEDNYLIGAAGGGFKVLTATSPATNVCSWPYFSITCATTVLPKPIALPLVTANLRITTPPHVTAINGQACFSSCPVYEGETVTVSLTVYDSNSYVIAGNVSVPVYLYNVYTTRTGGQINNTFFPIQEVVNGDFSSLNTTVLQYAFTVPYGVSNSPSPYFWAAIDPFNVAPSSGNVERNSTTSYTALASPQVLPSDVSIMVYDACTGNVLFIAQSNTCDQVRFQATVTNSGDAEVNVGVTFLWNSTVSLGTVSANLNPLVTPTRVFAENMTVNPTNSEGYLVVSVASISPIGPPPFITNVTDSGLQFADYAHPVLTNFSLMSVNASGGTPQWANPCVATCRSLSSFQVGNLMGIQATFMNLGGPAKSNATLLLDVAGVTTLVNVTCQGVVIPAESAYQCFTWWHVNDTIFGGTLGPSEFVFKLNWENSWAYGVNYFSMPITFNVTIAPPKITDVGLTFSHAVYNAGSSELQSGSAIIGGTIEYEGAYAATFTVSFDSNDAGVACMAYVTSNSIVNGSSLPVIPLPYACMVAGNYYIVITVSYEGGQAAFQYPDAIQVNSVTTGGSTSFLNSPFFWIIIAVIVVVVAVAVFFLMRRMGKGNLVECGECGELIPESAIACPKCGAEFEKEMVRCSRCGSTIGATNKVCPDCSVVLVGKEQDPSAPAFARFTDRFRAVAKKELGDNYNEGAFWDWWKRQASYVPFNTFKQQQGGGAMMGGQSPMMASQAAMGMEAMPPQEMPQSQQQMQAQQQPMQQQPEVSGPQGGMKVCPSCGRNINESFLVCPFCGAVTR
jgi:RNA polymerase subunit RPABC4/transcription elongation factor Spt4